jgi:FG-GAP repeat.
VGDFNGDGNMDVAVASASAPVGAVTMLLGNGDGTFRNAVTYGGGTPTALAVGDLNGDGKPDLAMTGGLGDSVVVLLNTYVSGSGGSACAPVPALAN